MSSKVKSSMPFVSDNESETASDQIDETQRKRRYSHIAHQVHKNQYYSIYYYYYYYFRNQFELQTLVFGLLCSNFE
jgi:hypothetical protein